MTETRSDRPAAAGAAPRRGGLLARLRRYVREVVAELRKVIWPTRQDLITYTTVVLIFVVVMISIIGGFDYAFTQVVTLLFG